VLVYDCLLANTYSEYLYSSRLAQGCYSSVVSRMLIVDLFRSPKDLGMLRGLLQSLRMQ
jgi:hypothetical protein